VKEPIEADGNQHPGDFRLEDFLPFRLSVAAESVSRLINQHHLVQTGLGMSEWRLLAAVGRAGILSPTTAGVSTSMDKVKISRAAASLVARGVLRQSPDPKDGRGRLLRLTRKGTAAYAGIAVTARRIDATLGAGLTKTELNTLHKALGKLNDHAQSVLASAAEDQGA
jgi:DNA-binding MarR family transcriptional regulator